MKSSFDDPVEYDPEMRGWPVDLAADSQANCKGCGAPVYFVWIRKKDGKVKQTILSEALASRRGEQVFLGSHYSDCPDKEKF